MPRPLTSAGHQERLLHEALAADPLDPTAPFAAADDAEEHGREVTAELLRSVETVREIGHRISRPQLLALLRGALPADTDANCIETVERVRSLLLQGGPPHPSDAFNVERMLSESLGPSQRGDAMLQLLDAEGHLDSRRLQEQYAFQVTLLASLDLLHNQSGGLGIRGIDQQFHPLPSLARIEDRLQTPEMQRKISQGFNQLLLVPFALPLTRLIDAWKRCLLRNEQLLLQNPEDNPSTPRLDRQQPVWVWEEGYGLREGQGPDEDGRLVYFPQQFVEEHGGATKRELLTAGPSAGLQVLLVEGALTNIPQRGQGKTIGGRPQIEAGWEPRQYLQSLLTGECGWTPETYIAAFCTQLEGRGQVLDTQPLTYLTASYLPAPPGHVPSAGWYAENRQAFLGRCLPVIVFPRGARAAVTVL